MSLDCPPPKSLKYENHIEVLRHLKNFRSWGGAVWDSNVFSKSVTYRPTLSKFKGGPVIKNTLYNTRRGWVDSTSKSWAKFTNMSDGVTPCLTNWQCKAMFGLGSYKNLLKIDRPCTTFSSTGCPMSSLKSVGAHPTPPTSGMKTAVTTKIMLRGFLTSSPSSALGSTAGIVQRKKVSRKSTF